MLLRKGAAFAAALILCASVTTAPAHALSYRQFNDVKPDAWFSSAVVAMNEAGIMPPGYTSNFSPDAPVTAAEFSYALLLSQGVEVRSPAKGESWQAPYLQEMSRRMGEELGTGPVTRLGAAKMIAAIKQLTPDAVEYTSPFVDPCEPAAIAVSEAGIITGIERADGLAFAGETALSRSQMAAIIDTVRVALDAERENTLYADIDSYGFLIDPNITLPREPATAVEFRQVMEYMAAHDLTVVQLEYQGNKPENFIGAVKETLTEVLHSLRYERSEYFTYLPKTGLKVSSNQDGSYTLTITLAASDGDTEEMLARRRQAFSMANAKLNELYQVGALAPTMPERERAEVITQWLASNTKYVDENARLDHTAWSVFSRGTGVCDGYASALQLMLAMDNIQCWGQFGHVKPTGEPHQWTLAILDGELVGIDAVQYGGSKAAFGMTQATMDQLYQFN